MTKKEAAAVSLDASMESGQLVAGNHYAVLTVSPIYHGKLVGITTEHYFLEDAAWVVETGRLSEFVKNPDVAAEAEHVGAVGVERSSVIATFRTPAAKITTR